MTESITSDRHSIKLGVITDITGPLSFLGIANANVAKMVINDINSTGGLLGRQIDLYLEDSAHVRMNMYIAQAKSGRFEIVKNLGVMDPKECMQGMKRYEG